MASPELEALRAEVIKRHRDATKKVSRLRRKVGVEIGYGENDPRGYLSDIRTMNTREAKAHLNRLNKFLDRKNGFVKGANMRALPASKWRTYKRAEKTNRALGEKHFNTVKNVKLPDGETIGQYEGRMMPEGFKKIGFTKGNRAYMTGERVSSNVRSAEALDKLIDKINRANGPKYLSRQISLARSNAIATLTGGGVSGRLIERVQNLTDYQIDVLWNYTNFARDASEKYFFLQRLLEGSPIRPKMTHEDMEAGLEKWVAWAEGITQDDDETTEERATREDRRRQTQSTRRASK